MRANLFFNKLGRILLFDRKKIIIIAILARLITASFYDAFVSITDRDFLLPDGKFYSVSGWYIALLLSGYGINCMPAEVIPAGEQEGVLFHDYIMREHKLGKDGLPNLKNETNLFFYIIGILYFIFGYFPLAVRAFNILLSIMSVLLIFQIAKRQFSEKAAQFFLVIGLFLPTQFVYSIALSKDLVRMFIVSFILWIIYGGEACSKR